MRAHPTNVTKVFFTGWVELPLLIARLRSTARLKIRNTTFQCQVKNLILFILVARLHKFSDCGWIYQNILKKKFVFY